MGGAFLRGLMYACGPAPDEQRPKRHGSGNDKQPKTPTSVRRMRVDLFHANQSEWDGKHQSASQISSKHNQKHSGDHDGVGVGCCSDFNSAFSE
jgi:hypothetical protein